MKIDWQRGKIVVTLEANDLAADWKGFLAAVREGIPSRHREYRPDEKAWIIKERYAPLVDRLARQYLTTDSQVVVESEESLPSLPVPPVASPLPSEEPQEYSSSVLAPPGVSPLPSEKSASVLAPSAASAAVQDAIKGVPSSAPVSSPSSTWPFFLLSFSFAVIGWWMAATAFPSVWRYILLRSPVFPLFDGIIFGLSVIAGVGSTIYAIRLLFGRSPAV